MSGWEFVNELRKDREDTDPFGVLWLPDTGLSSVGVLGNIKLNMSPPVHAKGNLAPLQEAVPFVLLIAPPEPRLHWNTQQVLGRNGVRAPTWVSRLGRAWPSLTVCLIQHLLVSATSSRLCPSSCPHITRCACVRMLAFLFTTDRNACLQSAWRLLHQATGNAN